MPEKEVVDAAKEDLAEGKSPSTAAGEFVHEEIEHVREGKHGAANTKQAIAIGLSKARRAGIPLKAPAKGKTSEATRKKAKRETQKARSSGKTAAVKKSASSRKSSGSKKSTSAKKSTSGKRSGDSSSTRSRATKKALKQMPKSAASHKALSRQAKSAAKKRSASSRSASAKKAAATRKRERR